MLIGDGHSRLTELFNHIEKTDIPTCKWVQNNIMLVFTPNDWSVHVRYKFNMPRTDNVARGWHRVESRDLNGLIYISLQTLLCL